ncbi:NUDIX hydrolase, partial [Pseudoxanthobacter sp.]|uniref:NUDIX hydrolase n=1 Tax=Pseudoxanthobacter sp. TaxID=1925742 RepID=UPI002FDF7D90
MAQSKKNQRKPRKQVGVLPFRHEADGAVGIYLITSRETRRWVIPKGWPMKGRSARGAAQQEAYEEAGLIGTADKTLLGSYGYDKRMANGGSVPCVVLVYAMPVDRQLEDWPEKDEREGRWFTPADASAAVQEDGLAALILGFAAGAEEDPVPPDAAPAKANGKTAGPGHGTPPGKGGARKAAPKKAARAQAGGGGSTAETVAAETAGEDIPAAGIAAAASGDSKTAALPAAAGAPSGSTPGPVPDGAPAADAGAHLGALPAAPAGKGGKN